ncbi:MAG: hypothetical protein DYH03_19415 [Nitrospira sp. NTP1]|nr:hypothetical protein [Nitrospira sp. NTP1]
MLARRGGTIVRAMGITLIAVMPGLLSMSSAAAQSVSGVRGFNGGVAPLFNLAGPGNLYIDNQGTQGFIYNFGNNFESYNFRNPTTGQGLIQGANQSGSPVVFPPVPRDVGPVPPIQSGLLEDIP